MAERLVMTAHDRGIPTCIYRIGMITSHSQEIVSNMKRICEYPFSSDIELLCRIIQEDLEGEFVVYTQSFYQYHAKELDQIDKLKRKDHRDELTSEEEKKLWELIDKSRYPAIWYDRLIQVCHELENTGLESITPYLDINSDNIDKRCKMKIKAERDPVLKLHKRQSHYVEKGVFGRGVKTKWKP